LAVYGTLWGDVDAFDMTGLFGDGDGVLLKQPLKEDDISGKRLWLGTTQRDGQKDIERSPFFVFLVILVIQPA
jgi:hypothetical protein